MRLWKHAGVMVLVVVVLAAEVGGWRSRLGEAPDRTAPALRPLEASVAAAGRLEVNCPGAAG
ncbi:MAG: hypothetical protein ACUVS4_11440 [Chloroflexaceae bacterium]